MPALEAYTVSPTDTIRATMEKINDNGMRAVVVVEDEVVVGTVSDGDIRRAMLQDVLTISPVSGVMQLNPQVTTTSDPGARRDMIDRHHLTLLPIVDGANRLVDVELAYDPF
ncbi:CBS domain-containing protein [Actinomycetospora aeridis]|uniref:CBS domain-containing protein n=1 Tax=Actinomycetospora aeridis TaxID=3129231 RepID=A0ABU8N698_9PSEU